MAETENVCFWWKVIAVLAGIADIILHLIGFVAGVFTLVAMLLIVTTDNEVDINGLLVLVFAIICAVSLFFGSLVDGFLNEHLARVHTTHSPSGE